MNKNYIQANNSRFSLNGEEVILRGVGLGNWLNLEHFMIGLPGTEVMIRDAVIETYGKENAEKFWEKYYKCYVIEEDIKFIKENGFNTIRLPFNYNIFESDQNPYKYKDSGFTQIDRMISLCEKYKIYIILDMHSVPGGQNPDWHCDNNYGESLFWRYVDFRKRTISLWKYIAKKYKDCKWIAGYDLINEPCVKTNQYDLLNQFYNLLINEIRSVDKNHVLFIEGERYARKFNGLNIVDDQNISYSFHFYPFYSLEEYKKEDRILKLEKTLIDDFTVDEFYKKYNRPLYCGETGVPRNHVKKEDALKLNTDTLSVLEKNNISWTYWCYKDAGGMGVLYPEQDSKWQRLSKEVFKNFNIWQELEDASGYIVSMAERFSINISEEENKDLQFRLHAINQIILNSALKECLNKIPFDEFMTYPESFLFENCDIDYELLKFLRIQ